jgi:hypothetical protein
MTACSYEPHGRWEVTDRVDVLAQKFDPETIAFHLEKGDVCALSDKWYVKDMPYKEVSCSKGRGWISNDGNFRRLRD